MAFLDLFKRKDQTEDMSEPFGAAPGMGPGYPPPYPNSPYDFGQNQPMMPPSPPMQPQMPGQLNPQAYMPNLPPQSTDMTSVIQTLNSKMDLIANKLDNIITLLNNLLQYYQLMFRR